MIPMLVKCWYYATVLIILGVGTELVFKKTRNLSLWSATYGFIVYVAVQWEQLIDKVLQ